MTIEDRSSNMKREQKDSLENKLKVATTQLATFSELINDLNEKAGNVWRVGTCYNCGKISVGYIILTSEDADDYHGRPVLYCKKCAYLIPEEYLPSDVADDMVGALCPTCHKRRDIEQTSQNFDFNRSQFNYVCHRCD